MTLRVGMIDFLNSRPVYHALDAGLLPHADLKLVKGTPAELNRKLVEGDVDVASVSSIAYAKHADELVVLPGLSINSTGFVHSVNLVYRDNLASLEGGRIAVTDESATSEVLLRILLKERFHIHARTFQTAVDPEEVGASVEGALLIGDAALSAALAYPHLGRTDLGEAWTAHTGTPMVFALWCARRDVAERDPDALARAHRALLASKNWGDQNRLAVVEHARKALRFAYSRAFLRSYFAHLRYDLGPSELKGLETYYRAAVALGDIPRVPPLATWEAPR